MDKKDKIRRRQFLKKGAGLIAGIFTVPSIIPATVLGRNGAIAPSNKITFGCIGVGWQGTTNMENFLGLSDTRIIAVCDVDKNHLENARQIVNNHYGNNDVATYSDYRELLEREDIDAVSLGLPDHWHAIPAVAAAAAGKDIFGEKPLAHTIAEGRAIVNAVTEFGRIWQTGSWQRSQDKFRFAAELIRNGRIGKIQRVEVGLPAGHTDFAGTQHLNKIISVPPELDYEFWIGPAPMQPYVPAKIHKNWRWVLDFGGGQILDWVGHHLDIAHWGLGMEYTSPVEIEGFGEYPLEGIWNTATRYKVYTKYQNGIELILAGGYEDVCFGKMGTLWIGESGWVWVDRSGIDASPKSLLKETFGPNEIHLFRSPGHWRNFVDCIKSREITLAPAEVAHRSATPGHLGQISMLLGRKIKYDPVNEIILDDETAQSMLSNAFRSPWFLS
jgi:predicted dehydrogenase